MSYCQANLNGWFDDLLHAGERIATSIGTRQSTPVGYGTTGGGTYSTPPMFPPTYGAPTMGPSQGTIIGASLQQLFPYLLIGGVVYLLMRNRR
jgi:hypothetical protein